MRNPTYLDPLLFAAEGSLLQTVMEEMVESLLSTYFVLTGEFSLVPGMTGLDAPLLPMIEQDIILHLLNNAW